MKNHVANSKPTFIEVCSGVGLLAEAFKQVFPSAICRCSLEWDSYAAACQLARMEEKSVEPHPVWCGSLRAFDTRPFVGMVDAVIGGLPCQPYSCAGKRVGNADHRSWGTGNGPIPHALRIIRDVRPTLVWLENVPNWVMGGYFRRFGEQLSGMGYEIEEPVFLAASDVGASHRRERVFILAYRAGGGLRELRQSWRGNGQFDGSSEHVADAESQQRRQHANREWKPGEGRQDAGAGVRTLANAGSGLVQEPRRGPEGRSGIDAAGDVVGQTDSAPDNGTGNTRPGRRAEPSNAECGLALADTRRERPQGQPQGGTAARSTGRGGGESFQHETETDRADASAVDTLPGGLRRVLVHDSPDARARVPVPADRRMDERPLFAPGPNDPAWGELLQSKPFIAPAIESGFRHVFDGSTLVLDESRADQLRCGGNSVVVLQAALALRLLLESVED